MGSSSGMISDSATTTHRNTVIGDDTRIAGSPSESVSARRSCCSAIGPRISPTTAGATGMPASRISSPSRPSPHSTTRSTVVPPAANAPSVANTSTPA